MKGFISKVFVLALLAAVLGIAVMLVRGVIADRGNYREEALRSVGHSLAGPQSLAAGMLAVPYVESWDEIEAAGSTQERRTRKTQSGVHYVLPDTLDVSGQLAPDIRKRGVFRVNGYTFAGKLKGLVRMPAPESVPRSHEGSELSLGVPRLILTVGNARGIRTIRMNAGGQTLAVEPGTGISAFPTGVSASLARVPDPGSAIAFEVFAEITGAQRLDILPLGMESRASISSEWPHPSFVGDFLPAERRVRDTGFDAAWRTSAVASNARSQWIARVGAGNNSGAAGAYDEKMLAAARSLVGVESFAVALIDPVDAYVMSDRATKYAMLTICLTLALFAVYELVKGLRVHPMQYLLVGFAMVVFFLLLIALSEHIGFDAAYACASVACVGLISYYVSAILGSPWRAAGFASLLGGLYGSLYGILCSEQNALLLGALLLFAVLAGVMTLSRKADWNSLLQTRSEAADATSA
ncbi:cell envelope integrity protein CreD [Niveibacterium sp. 24ML]|uniref:cell envelope integrity protein CreD n=1 Tax=Niveibacterium sp. 24ML TaxID=2985512 RepID=UPI00226F0EF2|nr:cell envelope integrity protein CreD [Niveibacterium sp. 24ML]MCX9156092.1 cell envelope integrity protein CreD [Niveibacterium sp. 24ML]